MKKIEHLAELRQIQLEILDSIDAFCRKNDIDYSLSSGTLIGAVRHKGFIPWDDDVDIYMRREEYERFIDSFRDSDRPWLRVLAFPKTKGYNIGFAKVDDSRTKVSEEYCHHFDYGVNIDVFPVDDLPENRENRYRIFRKARIYRFFLKARQVRFSGKRPLLNNCVYALVKAAISPLSTGWLIRRIEKYARQTPRNAGYLYNFIAGTNNPDSCFPSSCMASYVELPFEGHSYKVMAGYHEYLTHTYGDYMQLPPESQRVIPHPSKIYYRD